MVADIYEALAAHLDELPAGFARTDSGVELRILQRLFTPDEAVLALHLTLIPEEARVIAQRAGVRVDETDERLQEMDRKGLILRVEEEGQPPRYMALQWVLGFWEGQVNRLTPELVEDVLEYEPAVIRAEHWRKAPQMRTIPVGRSLPLHTDVLPYELVDEIVERQTSLAVANCICRQAMRLVGQGCEHPEETCLVLGTAADYVVRSGRARRITLSEMREILQRADESGLVLQPDNAQDPLFICTCCGCCCGILRTLKRDPHPARIASSPFFARVRADACNGCGICQQRCQMDAICVRDGTAVVDQDRCIGCGLCVSTCPPGGVTLVRKPVGEQPVVPKNHVKSVLRVAQARGKLGMAQLVRMQIRSKLDRLRAPRE
jgi:ferredoxin